MQISSMAIRRTFFNERLAKRRRRSFFLISLITSQVTPSRSATSLIVILRVSCNAYLAQFLVKRRRASAKLILICRTAPQSRHSTRGRVATMTAGFRPIGDALNSRSLTPRPTTLLLLQEEQQIEFALGLT